MGIRIEHSSDGWGYFKPGLKEHVIKMPTVEQIGSDDWQILHAHERHHAKQFDHLFKRAYDSPLLPCFKPRAKRAAFKKAKAQFNEREVETAAYGESARVSERLGQDVEANVRKYARALANDPRYDYSDDAEELAELIWARYRDRRLF